MDWTIGHVPACVQDSSGRLKHYLDNMISDVFEPEFIIQSDKYCTEPDPLKNGKFQCNVNYVNTKEKQTLLNGSICKAECNEHYSVSFGLRSMALIECQNGVWNKTKNIDICYADHPK